MDFGIVGRTIGELGSSTSAPCKPIVVFVVTVVDDAITVVVDAVADLTRAPARLALRIDAMHAGDQAWVVAHADGRHFAVDDE
jgi:hypothetical protein